MNDDELRYVLEFPAMMIPPPPSHLHNLTRVIIETQKKSESD